MTATATERRTPLLNQVIAVHTTIRSDVESALTKKYHLLQRAALLHGLTRVYESREDGGFVYPGETQRVQVSAEKMLKEISAELTRLFDVTAVRDWTNQHARADVVLLGGSEPVTLLTDVPVTYLMWLEKALVNLETVIRKLPVLPAEDTWTFDPATDTFRSEPVKTVKSKKIPRNHVLSEATREHKAQVQVWHEDVPEGTWTTTKFSGALPASRVNTLLARVTTLTEAVKFAREQANMEDVLDVHVGKRVFDYLFAAD
jgi:hypothetical protein